ncbi:MAG: right-handed parallel beta-helix repeat-containing protein, partial [Euryarchaeota archaeon]|nr:right-handed parallel beta-helix repeat-containing protein [Euryarchaeota archaeon]
MNCTYFVSMVHKWGGWIYSIFVCIIGICAISTSVGADHSLILSDVSLKVTINNLETLPLGDIPQETIVGSVLILNEGTEVSPPFNIGFSLVPYSNKGRTVDLISRPGEAINPGSSGRVFLTTGRPEMLTPDRYYLKASLVIDGLVEDSLISSSFGSLGGGTRDSSVIPVYRGYKITKPGYYLLQQDITARDVSAVFEITCDNVTLDGNGFSISGPAVARGETNGVLVSTGVNKPLRRVTIQDLNISGFTNGIWLFDISDAKVLNTHISQAGKFGIRLDRVRSSHFSGNIIENCLTGIGVFKSYGNTFTDNMFKNQNNVIVNEKMGNSWSIVPIPGRNVLGGERRGGNVWLTSDGSGFSATARDSNGDGFTDMSFAIDADNIDYHPLAYPPAFARHMSVSDEIEEFIAPVTEEAEPVSEVQESENTQDADTESSKGASDEIEALITPVAEEAEPVSDVKESEEAQDADTESYKSVSDEIEALITPITEEAEPVSDVKESGEAQGGDTESSKGVSDEIEAFITPVTEEAEPVS